MTIERGAVGGLLRACTAPSVPMAAAASSSAYCKAWYLDVLLRAFAACRRSCLSRGKDCSTRSRAWRLSHSMSHCVAATHVATCRTFISSDTSPKYSPFFRRAASSTATLPSSTSSPDPRSAAGAAVGAAAATMATISPWIIQYISMDTTPS